MSEHGPAAVGYGWEHLDPDDGTCGCDCPDCTWDGFCVCPDCAGGDACGAHPESS